MPSEAQKRAIKKYHEKFDRLYIRIPSGNKNIYADHAASRGESLSAFVKRALDEAMERDLSE